MCNMDPLAICYSVFKDRLTNHTQKRSVLINETVSAVNTFFRCVCPFQGAAGSLEFLPRALQDSRLNRLGVALREGTPEARGLILPGARPVNKK